MGNLVWQGGQTRKAAPDELGKYEDMIFYLPQQLEERIRKALNLE